VGLIDLHCHILEGLDDAPNNEREIIDICKAAFDAGFSTLTATPHVMSGVYDNAPDHVNEAGRKLEQAVRESVPELTIRTGAEYYLDDAFLSTLRQGEVMSLGGSDHVLVELPMIRLPEAAGEFAFRIRLKGYKPILAHPERYADIAKDPPRAHDLVEMGYLLQINLGSIAGMYGRHARRAAVYMLQNDLVFCCASDIHSIRHAPDIFEDGLVQLRDSLSPEAFETLLAINPSKALKPREQAQGALA